MPKVPIPADLVRCGSAASIVTPEIANPTVETILATRARLGADAAFAAYEKATLMPIAAPISTISVVGPAASMPAIRANRATIDNVSPAPAIIAIRRPLFDVDDWVIRSLTALVITVLLRYAGCR